MGYNGNLQIKDSEFEKGGKIVKTFCQKLDELISSYKTSLVLLSDNVIISGETHEALVTYISYVSQLEGKLNCFGEKYNKIAKQYVDKIDKADRYLYEKNGSVVRNFTEEERKKLKNMLEDDNAWNRFWDGLGDFVRGKLISWFKADDVTSSKADIDACHKHLLDYNDATRKTIDDIFNAVYAIESKYGQSISGGDGMNDYYTCYFASACLFFYSVRDALNTMSEIIDPNGKPFTVTNINDSLRNLFYDIDKYYSQVINVISSDIDITIEQIEDFASQIWASLYFSSCTNAITMYLSDIGGKEAAMMTIFNMFDIAEGQLITRDEYEKSVIKEELMSILDEMAESYVYEDSEEQEVVSKFKKYIDFVKKYGEEWYNAKDEKGHKLNIDCRTKEGKAFKEFLDGLGGASEILKYGDDVIDVLAKYFTDYSKNLEILNSFLDNCSGNDNMSACAEEIKKLYKKQLDGILNEAYEKIRDVGIDAGLAYLGESLPPVKVVQTIGKTIGTIGEVTGLGEKYQSMYNALIYQDMYYSSLNSYDKALKEVQEAIKNGTNTGEEYQKMVENLKNTFNLTKNVLAKMFTSMAKSSDGLKRSYYEHCAYVASEASMVDSDKLYLGSYEDYVNSGSARGFF